MFNQFDDSLTGALSIAHTEAAKRNHPQIDIIHLLYGLATNPQSKSYKFFNRYKKQLTTEMDKLPRTSGESLQPMPSRALAELITSASAAAIQSGQKHVSESDLLPLLPSKVGSVELPKIEKTAQNSNSNQELERPDYLIDLNELAREGRLDPVIGRKNEIRSVMEILGRRSKNNPVLIGDAGVGKTAIIEGIADLIVQGKAPDTLKNKTILNLNIAALLSGTKFRGDFEERMKTLIEYVQENRQTVILFIDEIHLLVGAGKTEGSMDAANLLKPALARGDLNCIGATTHDEYRRFIREDSALDRRFRAVHVNEPTEEDAIEILMGLKDKFEIHHGIDIQDEAIYSAVYMSSKYMLDKCLPDKAIDLIDEGASALKLSAEALPKHLVDMESEIRHKFIFAKTGKADDSIYDDIKVLQKEFDLQKKQWEDKVFAIKKLSDLKNQYENLKFEEQKAEADQQWELASEIKYNKLPMIEKQIAECPVEWSLRKEDVAKIISRHTGVSVETILKTKQKEILKIGEALESRVYGQEESLQSISDVIATSHSGLADPSRPLGSFLLCGPSGVGKTETAKALAEFLFDNEESIIRFDLSEYSEKHSVSKLIGSPAGYVGYKDGGVLTEAVRKKPYSVLLFDEVEKAHSDFADILLQILDDGRLSDNRGKVVSFKNTIIILTSNAQNLDSAFKPEFLGRLDGILHYKYLEEGIMDKLIDRELMLLNQRIKDKNLVIELSKSVRKKLREDGFSKRYGARPLKSVFSNLVLKPLSKKVLQGSLEEGSIEARLSAQGSITFVDSKYSLKVLK